MRVDVVMGGPGGEAAVSRSSGGAIAAALTAVGHAVAVVDIDATVDVARLRPGTVVFNIVHGIYGEDGQLQDCLERHGFAFIGSDAQASRICFDKQAAKDAVAKAGVPIIAGTTVAAGASWDGLAPDAAQGLVLKPCADGSSVGLHLVEDPAQVVALIVEERRRLGDVAFLIEERQPGPEYTVGVLEDRDGRPTALPPIQVVPAGAAYDYEAKYVSDTTQYLFPDDGLLVAHLQALAVKAHTACGCRHLSRVDFIADADGGPVFLEINTLPGFTSHSLLPKAAARTGMDFMALVDHLVHLVGQEERV